MALTPQQRGAYLRCLIKRGLVEKDKAKELKDDEILKLSEPFRKKEPTKKEIIEESESEDETEIIKPRKSKKEKLSVEDLREFIKQEVEDCINNIDFSEIVKNNSTGGGYSNMIMLFVGQTVLKMLPSMIEGIMTKIPKNLGQPQESNPNALSSTLPSSMPQSISLPPALLSGIQSIPLGVSAFGR
jgi:hypothetical protein